jgi:hypothetical protein
MFNFNGMLVPALLAGGMALSSWGQAAPVRDLDRSAPGDRYRVAHTFASRQEAGTFLEMLSRKEVIAVQLEVIGQLAAEKKAELEAFNRELRDVFDLDPNLDYSFDADTGRVFEAARGGQEANTERSVPALILKEGPRKEQFTRLALARNATKQQILSFNLVQSEKAMEMRETDRALESAYGVTTNGTFRYAAGELTLYEKVDTP